MDLSIIIVSWNVKEKIKENLEAIFKSDLGDYKIEVFVVDNNSSDDTVSMIKYNFPNVKLIGNFCNLGFAKANNQAIKRSCGRYVLLLNPDMKVFPDTLKKMIFWADQNKEAAVSSCRLIDRNGELIRHVRRFPTFFDQLAIVLKLPHLSPNVLKKYLLYDFNYEKDAIVDSVRGAFFLIRRDVIKKIGLLDEKYFLWFEEVDYCRRVQEAGLRVYYTPVAECRDYVGQSFGQVKRGVTQKYFKDSMLKYFKKWHPGWQFLVLKYAWHIGIFITFIAGKLKIRGKART